MDVGFPARFPRAIVVAIAALLVWTGTNQAGMITVPNGSFESPLAPRDTPYASPEVDAWQKSDQPAWYDPSQNFDTPWVFLMGQFYNVPFPGQFIENCDGDQAAFLFALPETALFQDYDTVSGTNTAPSHAFNATFVAGKSYDLAVGVIGGGGSMQAGATLHLSLYYRDTSGSKVIVAETSITNNSILFPTNTHFVDFDVHVPTVSESDPWVGQHIGIRFLSTTDFALAGGYWDLDNVRLTETVPPAFTLSNPVVANGQFSFTVLSEPGLRFEVQASTAPQTGSGDWTSVGTYTNASGTAVITNAVTNFDQRYYRVRQL